MNKNNYKGRKSLSNLGISPILIVVVVLLVLVLGGVGYGYYLYTTNPFLKLYDAVQKNSENVKNFEADFEGSYTFNIGKLINEAFASKNSNTNSLSSKDKAELEVLNRDTTMKVKGNSKINNENLSVIASVNLNVQNLVLPDPINDSINGDVLGMDMYAKGINNKTGMPDVVAFKMTKLPENIKNPLTGETLNLDPMKNIWIDMSSMYKNPSGALNPLNKNTGLDKLEVKPINSFLTCEKKTLSFFQKISLARAGTKLFSKAENKGQVDFDGGKATSLSFEMDAKNKSAMVDALDEMSKIACKDSSNLENDKFLETIINGFSLSKFTVNYFIDSKTGLISKSSIKITTAWSEFEGSTTNKNINNTTFEEPKDLMPVEKFMNERFLKVFGSSMEGMNNQTNMANPMGDMNPSQWCDLTDAQESSLLSQCNSAPDTAGLKNRSGFCKCAISQVKFGPCSDKAGLQKRIRTFCSNY